MARPPIRCVDPGSLDEAERKLAHRPGESTSENSLYGERIVPELAEPSTEREVEDERCARADAVQRECVVRTTDGAHERERPTSSSPCWEERFVSWRFARAVLVPR